MACLEAQLLLAAYERALHRYIDSLRGLTNLIGAIPYQEYQFMKRGVERARNLAEVARARFEKHTCSECSREEADE
jgi:hypothetical protein